MGHNFGNSMTTVALHLHVTKNRKTQNNINKNELSSHTKPQTTCAQWIWHVHISVHCNDTMTVQRIDYSIHRIYGCFHSNYSCHINCRQTVSDQNRRKQNAETNCYCRHL